MKIQWKAYCGVLFTATLAAAPCRGLAQDAPVAPNDPKTVQQPVVPAPRTAPVPTSGAASPTKNGEAVADPSQTNDAVSPLEANPKGKPGSDADFLKESAISFSTDLAASNLAVTQASAPAVKKFAGDLVRYQTAAASGLDQLAASKNIVVVDQPDAKRQVVFDNLSKTDPAKFDKAYIEQMTHDYQGLAQYYGRQEQTSTDASVKHYIASMLPGLKRNAARAKVLYGAGPDR